MVTHPYTSFLLSFAGISEQARCVSSGSLRAHVELLEQRLQAPPILRLHPLLSHRGRHEHGVERDTHERERRMLKRGKLGTFEHLCYSGKVWWRCCTAEADEKGVWVARFLYLYFFFFGGVCMGTETPLVRFTSTSDPRQNKPQL